MEQKPNYIEYLKYAIQSSYNEFYSNGMINEGLLKSFLSDALYNLFSTGKANRFARIHREYLETNFQRDEIFNYLVKQYVSQVKTQTTPNLKNTFQQTVMQTLNDKGEEETENAIKNFLGKDANSEKNNNIDKFSITSPEIAEDLKKYQPEQLKKIICSNCVNNIISNPTIEIFSVDMFSSPESTSKTVYTFPDFAIFGSYKYDIEKVVRVMVELKQGLNRHIDESERGS